MNSESLLLFLEIVDSGNLSEAARRLRMTRANVSYRLKNLEKDAGVQLLRRTSRRAEPTQAGQLLYDHSKAIQLELLAAKESLAKLSGTLQGKLRIAVPSGYGKVVMADWLIEFKHLYPGIVLDLAFESRVGDLVREDLDFVVRITSAPPAELVARKLRDVRYVACASVAYVQSNPMPVSFAALRGLPIVTSDVVGRDLRLAGYRGSVREEVLLSPTLLSEDFVFLRQATLAGLGLGVLPDYMVQEDIDAGRVITCLDEWRLSIFGTQMYLLYVPNRHPTRAASAFIEFVVGKSRNKA
ncbi:LysR family transcriptional regulator [Ramlibacter sp. AN1015]|uniref:LysR family transcriptional regulator n=1 Tax=Ramlibacter sp. AN1015 TaxID=3133428 RepID=UPI0030BCDD57